MATRFRLLPEAVEGQPTPVERIVKVKPKHVLQFSRFVKGQDENDPDPEASFLLPFLADGGRKPDGDRTSEDTWRADVAAWLETIDEMKAIEDPRDEEAAKEADAGEIGDVPPTSDGSQP